MVKVYTSYNCSSCKKVVNWFEDHGIEYEDYNFFSKSLTEDEIKEILKYSENGFEDILSNRSKVYQSHREDIKNMTVNQLVEFIVDHPSILKRPIIIDSITNNMMVGYNKYDMEIFL